MKHVFKRLSPLVFFLFFILSTPNIGFAQGDVLGPTPPNEPAGGGMMGAQGGGLPGGDCDPLDPTCPIDGGLSALLIIGAGYGIKKVRQAKKEVNPE